jgi:hypothetical protein
VLIVETGVTPSSSNVPIAEIECRRCRDVQHAKRVARVDVDKADPAAILAVDERDEYSQPITVERAARGRNACDADQGCFAPAT